MFRPQGKIQPQDHLAGVKLSSASYLQKKSLPQSTAEGSKEISSTRRIFCFYNKINSIVF